MEINGNHVHIEKKRAYGFGRRRRRVSWERINYSKECYVTSCDFNDAIKLQKAMNMPRGRKKKMEKVCNEKVS